MNRLACFGKLPAHGDFVKSTCDVALVAMLDHWLAQVMHRLPANPRWKLYYDALAPLPFALFAAHRRHAIAGRIAASHDAAGRRFPFLLMQTLETPDPAAFASAVPLVLAPLWNGMAGLDTGDAVAAVERADLAPDPGGIKALCAFTEHTTMAGLAAMLGRDDLRHMLLGLGMLLQPVLYSAGGEMVKSLVLPLPRAAGVRLAVAGWWLQLIIPLLGTAERELCLFLAGSAEQPVLVLGFGGASADTLIAVIDPAQRAAQQISVADTSWVADEVAGSLDMRALASYLDQPRLPLRVARELFLTTFTGDTL